MGHRRARHAEDRRLHVHNLGKQIRLARRLRQSNERKEPLSDSLPTGTALPIFGQIALRSIILNPRTKPTLCAKLLLDFAPADVTFRENAPFSLLGGEAVLLLTGGKSNELETHTSALDVWFGDGSGDGVLHSFPD